MYNQFIKRFLDIIIVTGTLLVIWPVLLVVALCLYITNGGSGAFFTQQRAGKDGIVFKVIKFKSMTDEIGIDGKLLPDKDRITRLGKIIRKTSIDELPQLINIIKGDMSIIGPRPLLPEYTSLYDERQRKRLSVRPGLTGWAQAHGRNSLKLSTRFEMDVFYVEHMSFLMDLRILLLTIKCLFTSKVIVDRDELEGVDDLGFDLIAFQKQEK